MKDVWLGSTLICRVNHARQALVEAAKRMQKQRHAHVTAKKITGGNQKGATPCAPGPSQTKINKRAAAYNYGPAKLQSNSSVSF